MEPILNSHFAKFKREFDIDTEIGSPEQQKLKEAQAFEKFVNYVLFSADDPGVFTGDIDLLDSICVGGGQDTGIDGIGIKINDKLVRDVDEAEMCVERSKKTVVEFVFVQAKTATSINLGEFNKFGMGVKNFFSKGYLPVNQRIKDVQKIRDYIYSDQKFIFKLASNPRLQLYYATTGPEPSDANLDGTIALLKTELANIDFNFDAVNVNAMGGKQLIKYCRELENKFEVQINNTDIIPLMGYPKADIDKAYAFTCSAKEFLKLLRKDDGSLRRSLFHDNVRDYLGKSGVNNEIEKTIRETPEMFLLCNNGVTIVCADFDQVRDKLVKIENPQVVNGCQTSNSLFNLKDHPNIDKVQMLVRIISTDKIDVANRIVRGTNKQNQVLDEAFEGTLPFHQDTLEPFFLATDSPVKLFYERRSRQYNNEPLIKRTQVVNLRILTQTFVAMFLGAPHEAHKHEAKLLEMYAGERQPRRIFRDEDDPCLYYVCALTSFMFDKYFREGRINFGYRPYRAQLYFILRYAVGENFPGATKSKALDSYCAKMITLLTEPQFAVQVPRVIGVFDQANSEWLNRGGSRFAVKDRKDFTDIMASHAHSAFIHGQPQRNPKPTPALQEGIILKVLSRDDGTWIAFIAGGSYQDNIYFDNRYFSGDPKTLKPETKVRYAKDIGPKGPVAHSVQVVK